MGNSLLGGRTAKVMKVDGKTFKLRTPVQVVEVLKDYPDHDLIEWEAVRRLGIRARPLKHHQELKPKKFYFLIELPKILKDNAPRRVRSGIHMSAKDRLESLMLSQRSASDISGMMRPKSTLRINEESSHSAMRVKMMLPKAQVEKLVGKSKDASEAAEKLMEFCLENKSSKVNGGLLLLPQNLNR
ncbi:hypothetical protein Scep_016316 [Stephania cephalantha]|uniref:Uncharacterized protein n=1 Tax=Stephania cephalantha TaxID=152367 RepID=A0AAP0NT39_9MAGN